MILAPFPHGLQLLRGDIGGPRWMLRMQWVVTEEVFIVFIVSSKQTSSLGRNILSFKVASCKNYLEKWPP